MGTYLRIEGIDGSCVHKGHEGWIEISAFSHGLAADMQPRQGGASARTHHQDLNLTKMLDVSSPRIFAACGDGRHLGEARLEVWAGIGSPSKLLEMRLRDVSVASFQQSASAQGDENPVYESFSLHYGAIEWVGPDGLVTASARND